MAVVNETLNRALSHNDRMIKTDLFIGLQQSCAISSTDIPWGFLFVFLKYENMYLKDCFVMHTRAQLQERAMLFKYVRKVELLLLIGSIVILQKIEVIHFKIYKAKPKKYFIFKLKGQVHLIFKKKNLTYLQQTFFSFLSFYNFMANWWTSC